MAIFDILNQNFLSWISKNRMTFLLTVLLVANVYQYFERRGIEEKYFDEQKKVNERLQQITQESLDYERQRSEKLEFLLNSLTKYGNVQTNHP